MSVSVSTHPVVSRSVQQRKPGRGLAALARIEARRLLCHPVFLLGLALTLLFFNDAGDGATMESFGDGFAYLPMASGTLIAANLGALRSRRDRTEELYESLPRPRSARVAGQLLALLWTLPVSAALLLAALIDDSFTDGTLGNQFSPGADQLAQGPLMVLAFGAIGILLARIAPSAIAGAVMFVALIATAMPNFSPGGSWGAWLLPSTTNLIHDVFSVSCDRAATQPGCQQFVLLQYSISLHLVYVAGLTLLLAAGALIDRRRRLVLAALPVCVVALGVATRLAAG
jgi:hypothetical protein